MIREKNYLNRVISILLFTGTAIGLLAILQYAIVQFQVLQSLKKFIVPISQQGYIPMLEEGISKAGAYRSVGPFFHPNLLGIYLSMISPIAISLFVYENKNKRWYLLVSVLVMLGGILASGSRGSLLNFSIALFALFIMNRKNKRMLLFATSFLLISLLLISMCPGKVSDFLRIQGGVSFRGDIWLNAFDMFKKHPFIGWGLGTFPLHYMSRYGMISIWDFERILNEMLLVENLADWKGFLQGVFAAHNIYIGYGVEMGFLGMVLISGFYFIYFKNALHIYNKIVNKYSKALLAGFIAVILGNMFHGFFEYLTIFGPISISLTFFLIVAMTLALERSNISAVSNH